MCLTEKTLFQCSVGIVIYFRIRDWREREKEKEMFSPNNMSFSNQIIKKFLFDENLSGYFRLF